VTLRICAVSFADVRGIRHTVEVQAESLFEAAILGVRTFRGDPWIEHVGPGNSPPTQISTHGEFNSPRGCRRTFGSVGTAEATRIEADFTGTDCQLATFSGRVVLTKG